MKILKHMVILSILLIMSNMTSLADNTPAPSAKEKCPVCGMFVAKYPHWIASLGYKGAKTYYFDGPKDLFTFYLNPGKYEPGAAKGAIATILVKDYYSLAAIDGRKAFYVIGSDVLGPMGNELIPFKKMDDASEFMKDHKGKKILRFAEITTSLLKSME